MPYPCLQRREDGKIKDEESKTIKELALRLAESELRENDMTREQCLQQFREWIKQNKDIENCITDDSFLLRFLRTKKFSLPMAQQMLLKYLNFRRVFKYICYDLDYLDPKVYELINKGFLFVSPYRDTFGRRVIISLPHKLDPYKYTSTDITRVVVITLETLLNDEENQILGLSYVGDAKNIGPAYVAMWNITELATIMKWGEQSFPIRHKAFHIINVHSTIKYMLDFAKSRLSPKLEERINVHVSEENLHRAVNSAILPKEYGGEMPITEMVDHWKKELANKRERLLSYDTMNLLSDKGIIRRRSKIVDDDILGLQGSFRRLELD